MDKMKKLARLLLVLVMVLAMAVPAMAVTVTNSTDHTYKVYQIFTGTQASDGGPLGDIAWGDGINSTTFLSALKDDTRFNKTEEGSEEAKNIFADCTTAADVAKVLEGYSDNDPVAVAFAELAAKNVVEGNGVEIPEEDTANLATGYYVIIDQSTVTGTNDAKNPALLQVVNNGNFEIQKKYDVPKVEKKINENNQLVNVADKNIGDTVTFTLTATMPSRLDGYETYKVIFHDTMSEGLTFKEVTSVKIGDKELTNTEEKQEYKVETGSVTATEGKYVNGTTLTVTIDDVLALSAKEGSKIVVTYTATINDKAKIGNVGNPNKVDLEYSNNPSSENETGKTPEDEVIVFTYELDVTKTDNKAGDEATKLQGAEFVLYRKETVAGEDNVSTEKIEYVQVDAETSKVTGWTTEKEQASTLTSGEDGLFKIIGLDAGTYYLEETNAPAGYNLLTEPIKIVVTATIEEKKLTKLTISVDDEGETGGNVTTGIVSTIVVNVPGSKLPETGGMGTTMFYVVGGALVAGAVIVMLLKKRNAA